jgi:uncharacterized membrane protein
MVEQRSRGNRHGSKEDRRTVTGESVRRRPGPTALREPEIDEVGEQLDRESGPALGGERTVREELASIMREAALEVLGPIARKTTTQAAKYAVSKGPKLAKDALGPRLTDTLGPRIEEAGGAGALAKNALSSISGKRGGLLSGGGDTADVAEVAGGRRLPIHEWVDVAVPLETAFNQFTQFEDFAEFVPEAVKVEQVDDTHLVWHLRLWGLTREWEIEITDQEPNERIAWQSVGATAATGVVTFHSLSDRLTRIEVIFRLQPRGALALTASGLGMARRALRADLTRFKASVELREETGGSQAPARPRRERKGSPKRAARKPAPKAREERDEYEPDDAEDEPQDEEYEDDEEEEEYEVDEGEEEYDEHEPSAAEDADALDEEEEEHEPVTRRRGVRRRPPARPIRQSRGRS